MVTCLGVLREPLNSPNRETDDALILKTVMEQLRLQRVDTALMTAEQADYEDMTRWGMIVPMCESYPRLLRLGQIRRNGHGPVIVNPPEAVLSCYRTKMMDIFARTAGLLVPETDTRSVAGKEPLKEPSFSLRTGCWVKRGDVHNTCDHDVVFARDMRDVEDIRRDFARREIRSLLIQRHVDGDLIKFYGVGPGQWFTWFYHDPHTARRLPFELEDVAAQAERAAAALGLEIFGGDAIVSPAGPIYLIDINSWPSFSRVRTEASVQIARRLRSRLRKLEGRTP